MKHEVYYWLNGWVYAGSIRRAHRVNDVLKLNGVPYRLKVDAIDNNDARGPIIYCYIIE